MREQGPSRNPEDLTEDTIESLVYIDEMTASGRTWQELEALSRREYDRSKEIDREIQDLEDQIGVKRAEQQSHIDRAALLHAESERLQSPESQG